MKNQKNKGITLIALVITIVVLVILVGVSVSVAINTGLISNSKTAVEKYKNEQQNEIAALDKVLDEIDSAKRTWVQEETKVTDGTNTFNIGDVVTYTLSDTTEYTIPLEESGPIGATTQTVARKALTWKIIGVNENGRLMLISTTSANPIKISGENAVRNIQTLSDKVYNSFYGNPKLNTKAWAIKQADLNHYVSDNFLYAFEEYDVLGFSVERDSNFWYDDGDYWYRGMIYLDNGNLMDFDNLVEWDETGIYDMSYFVIVALGADDVPVKAE